VPEKLNSNSHMDAGRNRTFWITVAFAIKLPLFLFFAWQYRQNWDPARIVNGWFVESGDTFGYYDPAESYVNGHGYSSVCRMPGILPIYTVLRWMMDAPQAKVMIIFLQFICSTLSVYFLARTAKLLFGGERIFVITFFLYAVSSFVSIWDNVGYADSFSASFLIFSLYILFRWRDSPHSGIYLILSGIFLTWSVFFRPLHGLFFPLLGLIYLSHTRQIVRSAGRLFLFGLPLVLALSVWTYKNYKRSGTIILLQGKMDSCFPGITKELLSINELIIALGGDIQPWARNSAGEWFYNLKSHDRDFDLPEREQTTTAFNYDSLKRLRNSYYTIQLDTVSPEKKALLRKDIVRKSLVYAASVKKETPFRYYILNRLSIVRHLIFRPRLDNLPFPALQNMQWYHKIIKGGYFLLLCLVVAGGLAGGVLALWRRNPFPVVPFTVILVLGMVLGYAEQRYLVPVYPLFVMLTGYLAAHWKKHYPARAASTRS
jgi:hypothetical protein